MNTTGADNSGWDAIGLSMAWLERLTAWTFLFLVADNSASGSGNSNCLAVHALHMHTIRTPHPAMQRLYSVT